MRVKSIYTVFGLSFLVALGVYLVLFFSIYVNVYFEGDRHLWRWRIPVAVGEALLFIPHLVKNHLSRFGLSAGVSGNLISLFLILENAGISTLSFMACWSLLERKSKND